MHQLLYCENGIPTQIPYSTMIVFANWANWNLIMLFQANSIKTKN